MSSLCAAVIAAFGCKVILEKYQERPIVVGAVTGGLLIVLALDYLPLPLPIMPPDVPAYVQVLRDQPGQGALIDGVAPVASGMYFQTIHDKPVAFVYTSRVTQSVRQAARNNKALLDAGNYAALCRDSGFRYLVVAPTATVNPADGKLLYADSSVALYALTCST